ATPPTANGSSVFRRSTRLSALGPPEGAAAAETSGASTVASRRRSRLGALPARIGRGRGQETAEPDQGEGVGHPGTDEVGEGPGGGRQRVADRPEPRLLD